MSRTTAEARLSGQLPIDCFEDNSRRILKNFDEYYTLDEYIGKRGCSYTQHSIKLCKLIPKWHGQPNYVEVWVEKDSMGKSISSYFGRFDIINHFKQRF